MILQAPCRCHWCHARVELPVTTSPGYRKSQRILFSSCLVVSRLNTSRSFLSASIASVTHPALMSHGDLSEPRRVVHLERSYGAHSTRGQNSRSHRWKNKLCVALGLINVAKSSDTSRLTKERWCGGSSARSWRISPYTARSQPNQYMWYSSTRCERTYRRYTTSMRRQQ